MDLTNIDLSTLSETEKKAVLKILEEVAANGSSKSLMDLKYADYKEIPVDIITFIKDYNYLGKAWHLADGTCKLYPYWEEKLKELFPDNISTSVNNYILSGARGLGKSEIAITIMLYIMYRVMCLKNPHEHFNLKPTEKIAFSFMNITEALAMDIGISKFQNTVQMSPWFMSRGTLSGNKEQIWNPPSYIKIIIGSQPRHVIGQACISGDTEIVTSCGTYAIQDLVGKQIQVMNVNDTNELSLSDVCTVQLTKRTNEYYEIELEDGTKIKCTSDHKFLCADGRYVEAKDLNESCDILDFIPFGYVYKTTNLKNGKIYIGQKQSSTFSAEKYLGSGTLLTRAVKKYGKQNFSVELLKFCNCKQTLDEQERLYIKYYKSTDRSIGYNIAIGGQGGNLGPECLKKISKSLKENGNHFSLKGYTSYIDEYNKIRYIKNTDTPPESWKKGNISTGKIRVTNGKNDKFIEKDSPIPEGYWKGTILKGRKLSDETKLKMSAAQKCVDRTNFVPAIKDRIAITDGINQKFIPKNEPIPLGWHLGNMRTSGKHDMSRYYSDATLREKNKTSKSGKNNSMYGKGYKISGGKNGHATIRYFYKNKVFECRKDLMTYLKNEGNEISECIIRNFVNGDLNLKLKDSDIITLQNLRWEHK